MKYNTKNIIIISLYCSILCGCSEISTKNYEDYKPSLEGIYLNIEPRDFKFDSNEETKTGRITTENTWSFKDVPSWLSVSPPNGQSGTEFSVTALENEFITNREAVFFIEAKTSDLNFQRTITASQNAASPYIAFPQHNSSAIEVDYKSQSLTVDVDTNIPLLEVSSSKDWITAVYNPDTKTVNVEIQPNETDYSRNGYITLSSESHYITAKLTISQLSSGFSIQDGIAMNFDADGGTQVRTIKSDLPWTAKTSCSWIEFTPKSGDAGETNVQITLLPSYETNKRIGQIYFYFGEVEKKYIGITQSGRYLNVSPNKITLSADENASDQIDIDSNIEWEVSSHPEWLSFSQSSGNPGKTSITISAQRNNSLNSRSGTIIIKDSKAGGLESNITITQNGLDFGDNSAIEFSWKESSQMVHVPIPNSWTAVVSDDWISLSSSTGLGEEDVTIYVTRNNNEDLREGRISFYSEGMTIPLAVIQSGQYLTIDKTTGEIAAMGGEIELSVNYSVGFEASIVYEESVESSDWINLTTNDNTISINASYNPSSLERNANLIILPTDENVRDELIQGVKFKIAQRGRTITANVNEIIMYPKGGVSETYSIVADGEYAVSNSATDYWYSINWGKADHTFYIITAENSSGIDRHGEVVLSLSNLPVGEDKSIIISIKQLGSYFDLTISDYEEDTIID